MKYANASTGYEVIQDIQTGSVQTYAGFITDDYQLIGSAANYSIDIYENDGSNNFVFSYTLSTGLSKTMRNLKLCEHGTFLVASVSSYNSFFVYTRETGNVTFSLSQTITLQTSRTWKPSITKDHMHIVVGDQINSTNYVQIYTYNPITYQFDPPADPTLISTNTEPINYASLSEDKNYLAVSTGSAMYLYSSPLSSSPIL